MGLTNFKKNVETAALFLNRFQEIMQNRAKIIFISEMKTKSYEMRDVLWEKEKIIVKFQLLTPFIKLNLFEV